MNKRVRQYVGLLSAVLVYYVIHEGAHFIYALSAGAFRQVNFMGIGIQIGIYEEQMSNTQLGIFCVVGAVATMITAYALPLFWKVVLPKYKNAFAERNESNGSKK